jgi:hypothetical protein
MLVLYSRNARPEKEGERESWLVSVLAEAPR